MSNDHLSRTQSKAPGKSTLSSSGGDWSSPSLAMPPGYWEYYGIQLKRDSSIALLLPGMPLGYWEHYGIDRSAPVQMLTDPSAAHDTGGVHRLADQGVAGASQPIPHIKAIQQSFGEQHDVSAIRAQVGGPASEATRAMGAVAYAAGDAVAFREQPDLHTAAHEAAHVIQQRSGVQLKGGVGESGDAYERNADEVADRVTRGQSAADLLPRGASAAIAIQRKDAKEPLSKASHGDGTYAIRSSAGSTVKVGQTVTYTLDQLTPTMEATGSKTSYRWICENDPNTFAEAHKKDPSYAARLEGPKDRTIWSLQAEAPGTHKVAVEVLLNDKVVHQASFDQKVTEDGRTREHADVASHASKTEVAQGTEEWSTAKVVAWRAGGAGHRNRYIHAFKRQWVHGYRKVIAEAAKDNDLPALLVAGTAYNEVGGKPDWLKSMVHGVREVDNAIDPLEVGKPSDQTSFGDVATQVRRGAEVLGYEPGKLSSEQESQIIDSLKDHRQSVFIAARHLAELRDIDFKGKGAATMTPEDIKVTATRFNRGPHLTLEQIKKDMSYGETIMKRSETLQQLMND